MIYVWQRGNMATVPVCLVYSLIAYLVMVKRDHSVPFLCVGFISFRPAWRASATFGRNKHVVVTLFLRMKNDQAVRLIKQVLHVAMDGWRSSMLPVILTQGIDMWLLNVTKDEMQAGLFGWGRCVFLSLCRSWAVVWWKTDILCGKHSGL